MVSGNESWEARAAAKRATTRAKVPREWILGPEEIEKASRQRDITGPFIEQYLLLQEISITNEGSVEIVGNIKAGLYTATEVTSAFCKRAAIAYQINNCLHEIFFDQAFERARELDDYYAKHGKTMGPLHGLPISLKDQFHVKGVDTSMGYIGWIDTYEGSTDPELVRNVNSQIVTELLSLGAVLFCKTSNPQTLLPWSSLNLSCGGSSGGEGALCALGGTSLGIGTDIGGSVRIPAAFNGIFSVKPSHSRFSYRDVANVIPGQTTYPSSVGFMGSSLTALRLIMTSVLSTKPWMRDPKVVPIPWRQNIVDEICSGSDPKGHKNGKRPLKIGILWNDGIVTPHPPVQRGLRIVADAVLASAHELVDWKPPPHETAKRVHFSFLKADGCHDIHKQLALSGEPLIPQLRDKLSLSEPLSLIDYQKLTVEGRDFEAAYSDYWESTAEFDGQIVDAFIMPVAPHAAVIPGKYYSTAYTEAINLMDYSAVVLPVTRADKAIDLVDKEFKPLSGFDKMNWEAYDPEIYDGAPVGVQIIARKFEEEKIWAIGRVVQDMLEFNRSEERRMSGK